MIWNLVIIRFYRILPFAPIRYVLQMCTISYLDIHNQYICYCESYHLALQSFLYCLFKTFLSWVQSCKIFSSVFLPFLFSFSVHCFFFFLSFLTPPYSFVLLSFESFGYKGLLSTEYSGICFMIEMEGFFFLFNRWV